MLEITIVFNDTNKIHEFEIQHTSYTKYYPPIHALQSINLMPSLGSPPPGHVQHNMSMFNSTHPQSAQLVGCSTRHLFGNINESRKDVPSAHHKLCVMCNLGYIFVLKRDDDRSSGSFQWTFAPVSFYPYQHLHWVQGVPVGFEVSVLGSRCPCWVQGGRHHLHWVCEWAVHVVDWLWMSLLGGRAVLVIVRWYASSMEGMRL